MISLVRRKREMFYYLTYENEIIEKLCSHNKVLMEKMILNLIKF